MQRVWAVGDSLTWGVGWPGATAGSWRALVADALDAAGIANRWVGGSAENPAPGREGDRHDGHPGWRAEEIASLPPVAADLAIVQGGTNDLIQRWAPGRTFHQHYDEFDDATRAQFAADLAGRLDAMIRSLVKPETSLLLWTIPPIGRGGPRYASPTLPAVNALIHDELAPALRGDGYTVTLADLHTALAPGREVTAGLLGQDGVHPATEGYRAIAGVLETLVAQALSG